MSGYNSRSSNRYNYRPRYRPRRNNQYKYSERPQEEEEEKKTEAVQADLPKTYEQGVQIDMGDGIPCRIIPINPDDYPRLLALLKMQDNS